MEYTSLENIRNKYPDELSVSEKYTRKGNTIVYSGKSEYSNVINLDFDISNINIAPNTSFKFIVDIGGSLYTSSTFLNLLQNSEKENNPYFQKRTVPILKVDLSEATTKISDQSTNEKYAEVKVTDNLNVGDTTNKILQHIDWLVSEQTEGLRDIKSGNNRVYGNYQLNTGQYIIESDSGLGFEFTDAVESGLGENAETGNVNVPDTTEKESTLTKSEDSQYVPATPIKPPLSTGGRGSGGGGTSFGDGIIRLDRNEVGDYINPFTNVGDFVNRPLSNRNIK